MKEHRTHAWDQLPEYRWSQRFGHSLERVIASLPQRWRKRIESPLTRASALMSCCIVMMNAGAAAEGELPAEAREDARRMALEAVSVAREGLQVLQRVKKGSVPDLLVALDLLDRIEQGIRTERSAA